jgi:DEAD/DEAH box helicase domain-containing protein
MDKLGKLLSQWRAEPTIGGNVTKWHEEPAKAGEFAPLPENLEPRLAAAFSKLGFEQLYSHQRQAWDLLQAGKNVAVVAGTASGKTLCYNLPVLDAGLRDPEARALYLFPTKALGNDQYASLQNWLAAVGAGPELSGAVYDGDTPSGDRSKIRKRARLIFTNPDMLNVGILPYHTRWAEFFGNLRYVVLDEMHAYRGLFGSHVANVIRRLKRICAFYGSEPQFILTSATIGNPQDLAQRLVETPVELIDQDGSPHGPRSFLIYNPPIINPDLGIRQKVTQEAVQLASDILAQDIQTIVFGRTRRTIEIMLTNLRAAAPLQDPQQIRGYRSGYLRKERREIEEGLRSGAVRAVVSTTALELGVDIGGLDAAVLAGYPGTLASTRQQAGRAGRGMQRALVVLLVYSNPLEQFLARQPDYLFERTPEYALINPDNLLILLDHLRCAAFELPFKEGDAFGSVNAEEVEELLRVLVENRQVHQSGPKYFWMSDQYPARDLNLRGMGPGDVALQSHEEGGWKLIGQVDRVGAMSLAHPEAIYIHEGRTYFVDELNLDEGAAKLHPVEVDYYTYPVHKTALDLVEDFYEETARGGVKHYGRLLATDQITRYERVSWTEGEGPGGGELDMPPTELNTVGYWFVFDEDTANALREQGLWRSDANDYGPNWGEVKLATRERDEYRCRNCGAAEEGRVHDVHHRQPFRSFASYKEANKLDNLVTLCPKCHRQAENMVRVRTGLGGLTFVLGHLAPLFLMCDPHDIGTHSDPQSTLAEGAPVVAFYDNVPDGIGLSQRLYEVHDELMRRAYDLVQACECADGCPACVGPGGEQGEGSKKETLAILSALTGNLTTKDTED